MVASTPRAFWGAGGGGDVPVAGAAGTDVLLGGCRGWEAPGSFPGGGRRSRFLLASRRSSIPPLPAAATASGGPPCPQAGRGQAGAFTPRRAPRGDERWGAGTHPLGDGAAPGALPLLPRVDDLLDADGLALLAVPARGRASAPLAPTMLRSPPARPHGPLTSPHSPHGTPLALAGSLSPSQHPRGPHRPSSAPAHPHGTPSTLPGPHSPSQDPRGPPLALTGPCTPSQAPPRPHGTPHRPPLALTGPLTSPSSPLWAPARLHKTPLALMGPLTGPHKSPYTLTAPENGTG